MNDTPPYGWHKEMNVPLLAKLKEDLKWATKARDESGRNTIRLVMAEFPKLTVPITLETGKKTTRPKTPEEITDEEILDIIRGLVKSEKMVLELKNEPPSVYLTHLESYLPKMAGREEITAWIRENVDLSRFSAPMQAMGTVMKHFGKLADGNLVKEILKEMGGKG